MSVAVLLSGGLDSAVLVADEATRDEVQPIYVSAGLAWERAERAIVARMLAAPPFGRRVRPLVSLGVDMRDVYAATHWSVEGRPPAYHTPDEDVYLPGRNIVLLAKAGVYCATARIDRLVLGTLAHNPFPDPTPEVRDAAARALTLRLARHLPIDAPSANMVKADVTRRGAALGVPFALPLSCMNPPAASAGSAGSAASAASAASAESAESAESAIRNPQSAIHCGECSKCRERND